MKRMLLGALLFSSLTGSDVMAQAGLTMGDSILLTYSEVDGGPRSPSPEPSTGFRMIH